MIDSSSLPLAPSNATAHQFISLMESIWDGPYHYLYDHWHNARHVAVALGAIHTGSSNLGGPLEFLTYRLPTGEKIRIQRDGGGVALPARQTHDRHSNAPNPN